MFFAWQTIEGFDIQRMQQSFLNYTNRKQYNKRFVVKAGSMNVIFRHLLSAFDLLPIFNLYNLKFCFYEKDVIIFFGCNNPV